MNVATASVSVIVPVFNGLEHLRRLFSTLLANTPEPHCQFLIVDDASTDPEVLRLMDGFAAEDSRVRIVRNDNNVGFVRSVNRALRLAKGKHCILLNSDTQVPKNWLPRLLRPILDDPTVASVTPFSNGALSFSLPVQQSDNRDFMRRFSLEEIDAVVSTFRLTSDVSEAPVGHGFCLAMNRLALERVGILDEETFSPGYGEETDWCLRASAAGFRHVVACDLYVAHHHCGTFLSEEKERLRTAHAKIIFERYPELTEKRQLFRKGNARVWSELGDRLVDALAPKWNADGRMPLRILVVTPNLEDVPTVRRLLQQMKETRDAGDIVEMWTMSSGPLKTVVRAEGFKVSVIGNAGLKARIGSSASFRTFDLVVCCSVSTFRFVRALGAQTSVAWLIPDDDDLSAAMVKRSASVLLKTYPNVCVQSESARVNLLPINPNVKVVPRIGGDLLKEIAAWHERTEESPGDADVLVSVVIPIINAAPYLSMCLDSVLGQTHRKLEVLCVDDCSTDDTPSILGAYAGRDIRLRVLRTAKNSGSGVARNLALDAARGEYVCFMDPDDCYPNPHAIASLLRAARCSGCSVAGGTVRIVSSNESRRRKEQTVWDEDRYPTKVGLVHYDKYQAPWGFSLYIYRRGLLEDHGVRFPPCRRFQDPEFFVRAMSAAGEFYFLHEAVYSYRVGENAVAWTANGCRLFRERMKGMASVLKLGDRLGYQKLVLWVASRAMKCCGSSTVIRASRPEIRRLLRAFFACRSLNDQKKQEVLSLFMRKERVCDRRKELILLTPIAYLRWRCRVMRRNVR